MLLFNVKALMAKKSAREKRKITYKVIEQEAGIHALKLSRIASNHDYNMARKDIEKLLIYFNCQPNDLMTVIREDEEG
jgi:DNA-binding Xre family transcriptional regulator